MRKHAYLIIASNEGETLKYLIRLLDDVRNDIFIHMDKKHGKLPYEEFKGLTKKSNLTFLKNRLNVKWGGYSQIECELRLLEAAVPYQYEYYHLLSGSDLPLKSQNRIHDFFDKNIGTEFVQFDAPEIRKDFLERVSKYYLFAGRNPRDWKLRRISLVFQKNVDRLKGNRIVYQKGANWFSISHALAEYVVENRKFIRDNFKYTFCGDEMFLQTLVWNSKFKNLINQNNYCGSASICRYIDWKRGGPYTFHDEDYEELMNCGQLFARKFNWEEDKKIILRIYERLAKN